jgi:hypothetical protein
LDLGLDLSRGINFWLDRYQTCEEFIDLFTKYAGMFSIQKKKKQLSKNKSIQTGWHQMLMDRWHVLRVGPWSTDKILTNVKNKFDSIGIEMQLEKMSSSSFEKHKAEVLEFVQRRLDWMDLNISTCCPFP